MSANSIIANCKYQLYRLRSVPLIYLIWTFGSMLLSAALTSIIEKVPFSFREAQQNGLDILMGFFVFGFMCANITDFFNTAAANGTSRTTACVSAYISSVIFSIVSALEVSVIFPIMSLITKSDEIWAAVFYGVKDALIDSGWNEILIRLRFFGIATYYYIAICAIVILLGAVLYKFPGWLAIIIEIMIFFIPTGGIYLTLGGDALESFWSFVGEHLGLITDTYIGNASRGAVTLIVFSLILLLLSCLITRRSSVKPPAIKGS